ncbi:MAG: NAD(P)-dependent oxidoreductase [Proteobacteria bacterium]|nr:NAD(P)-dependent oxidoreductase [Pseudomonadota bacterium]
MIIGNGQLAKIFKEDGCFFDDVVIFASGVTNSDCRDDREFNREKELLEKTLVENNAKRFVYFSSCALSAKTYEKNEYYQHKQHMEDIIRANSNNYLIFRIPQLFGNLIRHKTIINFFYKSIQQQQQFNIFDEAYRYVIEINDVKKLVKAYLEFSNQCSIVDLANPYRYKVFDIVKILEQLLEKKAVYRILEKEDKYKLDFSEMKDFIKTHSIHMPFGPDYLFNKLKEKIT